MAALTPLQQANLQKIENFVVLMFENRSFDHLAGYLRTVNPAVEGPRGTEFNLLDPNNPASQKFTVSTGAPFSMPFDPDHEFDYVNLQLYGSLSETAPTPLMNGFVESATNGGTPPAVASLAMKCFAPEQLRVFSALCREFALFNFWFSSLPGPTWPNRFFVHAATSGGLCVSPNTGGVISGFSFSTGTIYDRLSAANIDWRIYHNGLPQTAGIDSLRDEFIDPFTDKFSGVIAEHIFYRGRNIYVFFLCICGEDYIKGIFYNQTVFFFTLP